MLESMGLYFAKKYAGKFIKNEISKLATGDQALAEKAFDAYLQGKNVKKEVYDYLDGRLTAAQGLTVEQQAAWFAQARIELKKWLDQ